MLNFRRVVTLVALTSAAFLSGCSSSFDPMEGTTPPLTTVGSISGVVHGGQGPIVGASVSIYQQSVTSYGGASTLLAGPVTTDSHGSFNITSYTTTCTSGYQTYIYSVGGNPGAGVNSKAGLMAALGPCPSSGTLDQAYPSVYVNEVSTVAMAFAVAGFATDATHIGTSGSALAQVGIKNAFANAGQMYYPGLNGTTATANGTNRAALAMTPNGNGTVPQTTIDTLANVLAACVNTQGVTPATSCSTLFGDTPGAGDTASAAIYIAQHPAANVPSLYGIVNATGSPFQPALSSAPATWVLELIFTGGGMTQYTGYYPNLAIDGAGNAWVADTGTPAVSELSPLGVPISPSGGYVNPACGLSGDSSTTNYPANITIDPAGNAWAGIQYNDAFCIVSPGGTSFTTVQLAGNDTYSDGPNGLAFDASGNAWATSFNANYGASEDGALLEIASTGSHSIMKTLTTNGIDNPFNVAIESPTTFGTGHTGDIWVSNEIANAGDSVFTSSGGNESFSPVTVAGLNDGSSAGIDSNGYIWTAAGSNTTGYISKNSYNGTTGTTYTDPDLLLPVFLALDGAGNVWVTNDDYSNNVYESVVELNNNGTQVSPASGFIPINAVTNHTPPIAIAVDGSGDVWYTMYGDSTLRELIGAATPVATPLAYGVANNKLGSKP